MSWVYEKVFQLLAAFLAFNFMRQLRKLHFDDTLWAGCSRIQIALWKESSWEMEGTKMEKNAENT